MTTAADFKYWLAASHQFDAARGVFAPANPTPFAYSDGAASEAYLASVMRAARDLAVGSGELAGHIRDWPSLYHLGTARQNLLRPLPLGPGDSVLEIGAGCGAITRYLGESGAAVLAIEGSLERATIAAARCRDLPNVVIACANFQDLNVPFGFDLVTLIGVLEYSRMFLVGEDPVQAMLGRVRDRLGEDGLLAIAIENQLGLKYLAGAREDHTDHAFFGVTDQYLPAGPVTFGEKELRERLARAGYEEVECLYPFPDYKLPSVLVTERGFGDARFNVTDLVATTSARHHPHEGKYVYSESLARGVFVRNGLGAATANSFLALAARSQRARQRFPEPAALAFSYSSGRERCYAKETRTVAEADGIRVRRRRLYEAEPPRGAPVRQRLADEDYVQGEVMYRGLERILGRHGWSVDDLAAWARPLVELLRARAEGAPPKPGREGAQTMPADLFDCTPFNVVRRVADGALVPFDLEWEAAGRAHPSLAHVVFRGLWNSLARMDDVATPAVATPTDIASLAIAAMERLGLAAAERDVLGWIREEHAFFTTVSGRSADTPAAIPRFVLGGVGEHASPELPRVASGLGAGDPGAGFGDFRIQLYVAWGIHGYAEETSISQPAPDGARIAANLAFPPRAEGYTGLRLDPMNIPGLIRLERVAVLDARGEIVWETRRCREPDLVRPHQLRDLSRYVAAASGAIWFAEGADPNFEIGVPAQLLAGLQGGGAVRLEMSRLDASELSALVRLAELAGARKAR